MNNRRDFFHFKKLSGVYSAVTGYDFIFFSVVLNRSDDNAIEQPVFFDTLYKLCHRLVIKYLVWMILKRVELFDFNVH